MQLNVFSSVRYLRNEVDIAHVSFNETSRESVQDVIDFADLATGHLRFFVSDLFDDPELRERPEHLRKPPSADKIPGAIAYLRKYRGVGAPRRP